MALYNISIQQLQYFLAVAKHLNFTDAANSLYVSQPTLSKQVAMLESSISTKLFIRNKRSVMLTAAGVLLAERLSDVLRTLDETIEQAKRAEMGYKSRLKIGSIEGLETKGFLLKTVEYFKERHPDILISFEKHNFKDLRELLLSDQLDICLTFSFEVEDLECFAYQKVWETLGNLIMSTKHPLAHNEGVGLPDFHDYPFVMLSREISPKGYDGIIENCRKAGFIPKVSQIAPNLDSLLMDVEANMGVAMVDENVRLHEGAQIIRVPVQTDHFSVVAAWKKSTMNNSVALFRQMLDSGEGL